jgi:hypothetical protein
MVSGDAEPITRQLERLGFRRDQVLGAARRMSRSGSALAATRSVKGAVVYPAE